MATKVTSVAPTTAVWGPTRRLRTKCTGVKKTFCMKFFQYTLMRLQKSVKLFESSQRWKVSGKLKPNRCSRPTIRWNAPETRKYSR